jgi:PhnB protein
MSTVNVYLTFAGQCEEAFERYRSIFGGEFASLARFGEMPQDENFTVDEALRDRIMHVTLPISDETALMGSDTLPGSGPDLVIGTNFSVSVAPDSREEADRLFDALSEGGSATMPMADQFWDAYFGMCTDRFGIQWMINYVAMPAHG